MQKRLLLFIFLLSLMNGFSQNYCIKNRFSETPLFTDAQIRKDSNIVFAVAKHWNSNAMDSLRLDLYSPNTTSDTMSKRPLIVFAFGGGFLEGNRADMVWFCKEFAKRGYVTATIDYRIGWNCLNGTAAALCLCNDYISMNNAIYRALQDYNSALRFLAFKGAQYKIDPDNFFVSGASAGSITALHAAFMDQPEIDKRLNWARAQLGSIDSSGNLYPKSYKIKGVLDFCGAVFDTSCMSNNKDIPVVSFHDSTDCVVPAYKGYIINCTGNCYNLFTMEGSALIYQKAIMNGTCAELNINPKVAHCGSNYNYVTTNGSCFLKRVLCNTCKTERNKTELKVANCDSLGFSAGIGNDVVLSGLKLFPQPAKDILFYELTDLTGKGGIISITDMNGKQVYESVADSANGAINTGKLMNGIYFLHFETSNFSAHQKIVINR